MRENEKTAVEIHSRFCVADRCKGLFRGIGFQIDGEIIASKGVEI